MIGILLAFLLALVIAGIILIWPGRRSSKRPRRSRIFLAPSSAYDRFRNPTLGTREAMENLEREIKETRRHARHASHRPRPR